MSKKITLDKIEKKNSHLVVELIAEMVAEQAVGLAMKEQMEGYSKMDAAVKKKVDDDYKSEVERLGKYLVERAQTHYQYNKQFKDSVDSKKNQGTYGRDHLYMFMYHWSGFHHNGAEYVATNPKSYIKSIENWERDRKSFENKQIKHAAWGESAITEMGSDEAVDIAIKEYKKEFGVKISDKSSFDQLNDFHIWYYHKVNG